MLSNDTFGLLLFKFLFTLLINYIIRCFPHIVNLACKAILEAITNLKNVAETAPNIDPTFQIPARSLYEALERDPISLIRSLIRAVRRPISIWTEIATKLK